MQYLQAALNYRRAGACPPPCLCCDERSRGTSPRPTVTGRSRGTGPRATVTGACLSYRRAGACPPPCLCCSQSSRGTGPRATGIGAWFAARAGQTSALRLCSLRSPDRNRVKIRRSCPTGGALSYRSAGACPPPCPGYAARSRGTSPRTTVIERSRGTGPRATVGGAGSLLP